MASIGGGRLLSLVTFFAAAKKVTAAPHRGRANRPTRTQVPQKPERIKRRKHSNPKRQRSPTQPARLPSAARVVRAMPTAASIQTRRTPSSRRPTAACQRRARADRHATEPCARRVAEVERALIERRGEIRRIARAIRRSASAAAARSRTRARPTERSWPSRERQSASCAAKIVRITTIASRNASSERISRQSASLPPSVLPTVSPRPNSSSTSVTACGVKPVTSSRIGRDVGEGGKEAGGSQHADAEHHQHLRVFQHVEFAQDAGLAHLDCFGRQTSGQPRGQQADAASRPRTSRASRPPDRARCPAARRARWRA